MLLGKSRVRSPIRLVKWSCWDFFSSCCVPFSSRYVGNRPTIPLILFFVVFKLKDPVKSLRIFIFKRLDLVRPNILQDIVSDKCWWSCPPPYVALETANLLCTKGHICTTFWVLGLGERWLGTSRGAEVCKGRRRVGSDSGTQVESVSRLGCTSCQHTMNESVSVGERSGINIYIAYCPVELQIVQTLGSISCDFFNPHIVSYYIRFGENLLIGLKGANLLVTRIDRTQRKTH